jgi:hypothetical protein
MTFTKDQVAAVMRHVYTAVGAGVAVAVTFGAMGQEDADKTVELVKQLGEGLGIVIGALAALLPVLNALRAGKSASPAEQVRKVDQQVPGVVVVPVDAEGQATLRKATGIVKPIESPSNGEQP